MWVVPMIYAVNHMKRIQQDIETAIITAVGHVSG